MTVAIARIIKTNLKLKLKHELQVFRNNLFHVYCSTTLLSLAGRQPSYKYGSHFTSLTSILSVTRQISLLLGVFLARGASSFIPLLVLSLLPNITVQRARVSVFLCGKGGRGKLATFEYIL